MENIRFSRKQSELIFNIVQLNKFINELTHDLVNRGFGHGLRDFFCYYAIATQDIRFSFAIKTLEETSEVFCGVIDPQTLNIELSVKNSDFQEVIIKQDLSNAILCNGVISLSLFQQAYYGLLQEGWNRIRSQKEAELEVA